jgi:hypothetical protein
MKRCVAPVLFALAGMATPAMAQPAASGACHPAMPTIRSSAGQIFTADAYARVAWRERASGGKVLDYSRHIWRGKIAGRAAYLTFEEIPGVSGPNHHMDFKLDRLRAQPAWRMDNTRYDLGRWFVVRDGVLKGEWTVTNC